MKGSWRLLSSTVGLLALCGCITVSTGKGCRREKAAPVALPPAPAVTRADETALLEQIRQAATESLETARLHGLQRVAARPDLSPALQVYLVEVGWRVLRFDTSKVTLVRTLAANPALAPQTRQAILQRLDELVFESSRAAVREALGRPDPF